MQRVIVFFHNQMNHHQGVQNFKLIIENLCYIPRVKDSSNSLIDLQLAAAGIL